MATTPYTARVFVVQSPTGGDALDAYGNIIAYSSPPDYVDVPGFSPSESYMILRDWDRYTGALSALSQDCVTTPIPGAGSPVWVLSSLPDVTPGAAYSFAVFWDSDVTAASGQAVTEILGTSLPGWLTLQSVSASEHKTIFGGNAPVGLTSLNLTLTAKQGNGKTTAQPFSPAIASTSVYARAEYRAATRRLTIYVGADGTGAPTTQLLYAPVGYSDRSVYSMDRQSNTISSVAYYFKFDYNNINTGQFIDKISWLGQTRYFTLDLLDSYDFSGIIQLNSTVSLPQPGSAVYDGTTDPIVNNPPVVVNPNQFLFAVQGSSFSFPMPLNTFSDPDGDALTYSLEFSSDGGNTYGTLPGWTSYTSSTRTWTGTPPITSSQGITYKFRVVAVDGNGGSAADPFNLICSPPNSN